jgi:hypothetical protein
LPTTVVSLLRLEPRRCAQAGVKGEGDRNKVIEEEVRVLRPGGRLMIADIGGTGLYRNQLIRLGMRDVVRRKLGWRLWWPLAGDKAR